MHAAHDIQPPAIRSSAEVDLRLISALNQRLGLARLSADEREIVLSNLIAGLSTSDKARASEWHDRLLTVATASEEHWDIESAGPLHEVVACILEQPAPIRTPSERRRCICLGAEAAMGLALDVLRVHPEFAHGLRQLFRSPASHWQELARLDFQDVSALSSFQPARLAVEKLRDLLLQVGQFALPNPGALFQPHSEAANDSELATELQAPVNQEALPREREDGHALDEQPQKPHSGAGLKPLAAAPNLKLFELQCAGNLQADSSDPWRLPLDWTRLSGPELLECLTRLKQPLVSRPVDDRGWQLKCHAAARYLTLFTECSLRQSWGLPLERRGSLHYNVKQGLLRRDALVVAHRVDRPAGRRFAGRWWRTPVPQELATAMRDLCARHPEARTLGQLLEACGLSWELCQRLLNDRWPTSHPPEDARFAASLRPALLGLGFHPAQVSRVTGDVTTTPASDQYYLTFKETVPHEIVAGFASWAGLTPPAAPSKPQRCSGSPRWISLRAFRECMERLQQKVRKEANAITSRSTVSAVLHFHNTYSISVALQLLWGLGGRCERIDALTVETLFTSDAYIMLSDKRVDLYSQIRICPSTSVLSRTRGAYLEHLRSVGAFLERNNEPAGKLLSSLGSGTGPGSPAFHIFEAVPDGWRPRPLERADLVALARDCGMEELNQPRHFWFTELVERGVAQVAIESLLGHHSTGAEPHGYASGISVRDLCDYLRPELEQVQSALGFEPLAGRGRQDPQFHQLPSIPIDARLGRIQQRLLQAKIRKQDFLLPEAIHLAQDPPCTTQTLSAHQHLARLRADLRRRDLVARHPRGALLFNLVAAELVLSEHEVRALFRAAADGSWSVGQITAVEACADGRPVMQRILGPDTLTALHMVRARNTGFDFDSALTDLAGLLRGLDPDWPCRDGKSSLDVLTRMAAHWSTVEVAPGSMFICHHKAPFIPAADLARLHFRRTCIPEASPHPHAEVTPPRSPEKMAPAVREVIKHWANKDLKLGEGRARAKGCRDGLLARRALTHCDFEMFLIDLVLADLSPEAPFRQLSVQTVEQYWTGYCAFAHFASEEGTLALTPEGFMEAYRLMGGDPTNVQDSCAARWQMLHICAFLSNSRWGDHTWVPAAFLHGRSQVEPRLPRLPVYTGGAEIAHAATLLARSAVDGGGAICFAGPRLELQRERPLRIGELRYASVADLDPQASLLHITGTGHAHLKNEASRGSITIPTALARPLVELKTRTSQINPSPRALLFADSGRGKDADYKSFDSVSHSIRRHLCALTGRPNFRQHDLRVAAITDLACEVELILARLAQGVPVRAREWKASDVAIEHARFAWASRLARHASVLTTLRYYVCSGPLDLRHQLDHADRAANMPLSGLFVSAALNLSAQSLYARGNRARERAATDYFADAWRNWREVAAAMLPTPRLGSTYDEVVAGQPVAGGEVEQKRVSQAVLMVLTGTLAQAAADVTLAPESRIASALAACSSTAKGLGMRMAWSDARSPFVGRTRLERAAPQMDLVVRLAEWVERSGEQLPAACLRTALVNSRSSLSVRTDQQFLSLLPTLRALHEAGITSLVRPGQHCSLSDLSRISRATSLAGVEMIECHSKEPLFAQVSFVPSSKRPRPNQADLRTAVSPRATGRTGHLVLAALVLALSLHHSRSHDHEH